VKTKRIKLAVESRCEICGRQAGLEDMGIHSFLEEAEDSYEPADLEQFLLVLCNGCHRDIHSYPITIQEQESLIQTRHKPVRENIRAILAYNPKPYSPPEIDMEDVYREASAPHTRY
jgi:hypothetical protein